MSLPNYRGAASSPGISGSPMNPSSPQPGVMAAAGGSASFNILKERLRANAAAVSAAGNASTPGSPSGSGLGRQDELKANPFVQSPYGNSAFNPQKLGVKMQASHGAQKPAKAPDKPHVPFIRFSRKVWDSVKAQNPDLKLWELGKLIGQMWRGLGDSEKSEFIDEYEVEKQEYDRQMALYKNSPAYSAYSAAKVRNAPVIEDPEAKSFRVSERRIDIQPAEDEDEADEFLSTKHVAHARFVRNHRLINEVFSETLVPDVRSVVTKQRMQNLKRQVQQLTMHHTKLKAELNEIDSKFNAKKAKFIESSAKFQADLKAECDKTVTEEKFRVMVKEQMELLVKEREDKALQGEQQQSPLSPPFYPSDNRHVLEPVDREKETDDDKDEENKETKPEEPNREQKMEVDDNSSTQSESVGKTQNGEEAALKDANGKVNEGNVEAERNSELNNKGVKENCSNTLAPCEPKNDNVSTNASVETAVSTVAGATETTAGTTGPTIMSSATVPPTTDNTKDTTMQGNPILERNANQTMTAPKPSSTLAATSAMPPVQTPMSSAPSIAPTAAPNTSAPTLSSDGKPLGSVQNPPNASMQAASDSTVLTVGQPGVHSGSPGQSVPPTPTSGTPGTSLPSTTGQIGVHSSNVDTGSRGPSAPATTTGSAQGLDTTTFGTLGTTTSGSSVVAPSAPTPGVPGAPTSSTAPPGPGPCAPSSGPPGPVSSTSGPPQSTLIPPSGVPYRGGHPHSQSVPPSYPPQQHYYPPASYSYRPPPAGYYGGYPGGPPPPMEGYGPPQYGHPQGHPPPPTGMQHPTGGPPMAMPPHHHHQGYPPSMGVGVPPQPMPHTASGPPGPQQQLPTSETPNATLPSTQKQQ